MGKIKLRQENKQTTFKKGERMGLSNDKTLGSPFYILTQKLTITISLHYNNNEPNTFCTSANVLHLITVASSLIARNSEFRILSGNNPLLNPIDCK